MPPELSLMKQSFEEHKELRKDLPNILNSPLKMKRISEESLDRFVREGEHGRAGDEGYSGFVEMSGAYQAVEEGCVL